MPSPSIQTKRIPLTEAYIVPCLNAGKNFCKKYPLIPAALLIITTLGCCLVAAFRYRKRKFVLNEGLSKNEQEVKLSPPPLEFFDCSHEVAIPFDQFKEHYRPLIKDFKNRPQSSSQYHGRNLLTIGLVLGNDGVADFAKKNSRSFIDLAYWEYTSKDFLEQRKDILGIKTEHNSDFSFHQGFELGQQIHVVGEIQGNLEFLLNYLTQLKINDDFKLPKDSPYLVFNANSMNRLSLFGLEISYLLMMLSLQNPDKVTLLKGNASSEKDALEAEFSRRESYSKQKFAEEFAAVSPAVFIAYHNNKMVWASHSMDPRVSVALIPKKCHQGISYQAFGNRSSLRWPCTHAGTNKYTMEKVLGKPDEAPGGSYGITATQINFNATCDLECGSNQGIPVGFISLDLLERAKKCWAHHEKLQFMVFGNSKEVVKENLSEQALADGTKVQHLNIGRPSIQAFKATEEGWEALGQILDIQVPTED